MKIGSGTGLGHPGLNFEVIRHPPAPILDGKMIEKVGNILVKIVAASWQTTCGIRVLCGNLSSVTWASNTKGINSCHT